jgi:hypothetical protein
VHYDPISAAPIPFHKSSWYRFAKLGLIRLHHFGGRTFISSTDIEGIEAGRIRLPAHPTRSKPIRPKAKPPGRPRKPKADAPSAAE